MNAQNSTVTIDRELAIQTLKALCGDISSLDVDNFRKQGNIREVAQNMDEGNRGFARYLTSILKFADAIGITEENLFELMLEGKKRY